MCLFSAIVIELDKAFFFIFIFHFGLLMIPVEGCRITVHEGMLFSEMYNVGLCLHVAGRGYRLVLLPCPVQ